MKNVYNASDVAGRYDAARKLPEETKIMWLNTIKAALPVSRVDRVIDLGCGTGRFTTALRDVFACPVVGVEPSEAMLNVAESQTVPQDIQWHPGSAEDIPLESQSADLVFMSQVFHHLEQPRQALQEIHRVLTEGGCLAVRNGTQENNEDTAWFHCFPEAVKIDEQRILPRETLTQLVCSVSFELLSQQTLSQLFALTYQEYFEQISQRGLSSLVAISDEAFNEGLERLRAWIDQQPEDLPVYEPVDIFLFRKI